MPKDESFDITTGCDPQEVDNAVNQALRELTGRYDFKGATVEVEYDRGANTISIHTDDEYKLQSIWDTLVTRFVSRKVPVENLRRADPTPAASGTVRQTIKLVQGIDSDTGKKISQFIRDQKLKNVKAAIQGEAVRVSGPSRDDLQAAMAAIKGNDWGIELDFGNYR